MRVREGVFYIATFENPSRVFKLTTTGPVLVASVPFTLHGLAATSGGNFYLADDTHKVYRTPEFQAIEPGLTGARNFTDVAVQPAAATRPKAGSGRINRSVYDFFVETARNSRVVD